MIIMFCVPPASAGWCCLPHLHLWCAVYVIPLGPVGVKCEPLVGEQSGSVPCGFTNPAFHVVNSWCQKDGYTSIGHENLLKPFIDHINLLGRIF